MQDKKFKVYFKILGQKKKITITSHTSNKTFLLHRLIHELIERDMLSIDKVQEEKTDDDILNYFKNIFG